MSVKNDRWIKRMAIDHKMISPFSSEQVRIENGHPIVSYGVSSYGYDIRCSDEFWISNSNLTDTNEFIKYCTHINENGSSCIELPPGHIALTSSVEHFRMPRDVLGICLGKSTYARHGVIANITPLEPEWCGFLTIELSNTSSRPVLIYANQGIAQLIFHSADEECEISYKDKQGKYQAQEKKVVFAKA